MASDNTSISDFSPLLTSESLQTPLITEGRINHGNANSKEAFYGSAERRPRYFTYPVNSPVDEHELVRTLDGTTVSSADNSLSTQCRSHGDAFDESGTLIRPLTRSIPEFIEHVPYLRDAKRTKYEEAALYVQEGINNDKFASHPNGVFSKVAYKIVHNPFFYIMEFIVCCLLMGLAIIEEPAWILIPADDRRIATTVHSVLEMLFLSIIAFNILLRFIWMKPRTFLRQRSALTVVIMGIMFIEALVVLVRSENHFRVSRCLRPIFFVDSYVMVGVRRVLRQILQCLSRIIDVLLLLFFMVAIFALAGYYLFADIAPTYFDSYLKSFVSLFITLTTANHPNVFMEAYVRNKASPLFFILYLFITLYFFSNVLLAVLYARFSQVDKDKFRKLYLHKREALRLAYFVLAKNGKGINFHDFMLFMLEYKPRIPEYNVMFIFKALQHDPNPQEYLCLEEFMEFYTVQNLQWKQADKDGKVVTWYDDFSPKIQPFFRFLHKIVKFQFFNSIMALIVILNALFLILFTLFTSIDCAKDGADSAIPTEGRYCHENRFKASHNGIAGSFIFTTIYIVEITMRILAIGPRDYFRKWWNRFDFIVILLSFVLLCAEASSTDVHKLRVFLVVFRPIKLIRLLRLKKRYYDIMNTVFSLGHRLLSVMLLLVVVFYFYAIIGMEVFQGAVYVGCCENALYGVGNNYHSNATVFRPTVYWMNNFDNIYQSYVILYEEMVVNNWFVQMEGFVSETNIYSRLFFFAFWMTTTVILSVVIAYIVDAFVFRVQAAQKKKECKIHGTASGCSCNRERKKVYRVDIASEEINTLKTETTKLEEGIARRRRTFSLNYYIRLLRRRSGFSLENESNEKQTYIGKGLRTREDLNLEMYKNDLEEWEAERDELRRQVKSNPHRRNSLTGVVWQKMKSILLFLLE